MAHAMTASKKAPPRPDLAAYNRAIRLDFPVLVKELRDVLGAKLVAYIAGVNETRAVQEWAEGSREPKDPALSERLRIALQVALLISDHDNSKIAQAWFQGLNPQLDDRSPARLLREGDLTEVGPEVIAAARAFLAGG